MKVEESYGYVPLAANAAQAVLGAGGGAVGGFLCTTAGSIKLTTDAGAATTILATMPVVAGTFYPIPVTIPPGTAGLYVTLTGGAAGTMFVNM